MIEDDFELLLEKTAERLITDINTDLMRLNSRIHVVSLGQIPDYLDSYEITFTLNGERGVMIGVLITDDEFQDYDRRHMWTMDVAEALVISN